MAKLSENILKAINEVKSGIKVPTGDNSAEEIAYSTTDLILGIAAVGMFGTQFKSTKSNNINTVLGQKSFLAKIYDEFKQIKTDPNKQSSLKVSVINTPTVKLDNDNIKLITDSIISLKDSLKEIVNPKEQTKEIVDNSKNSKQKNEDNVNLKISGESNFSDLIEAIKNLGESGEENAFEVLNDIIDNLNKLSEKEINNNINLIEQNLKTINDLLTGDTSTKLKDTFQNISKLFNDIDTKKINNIGNLSNALNAIISVITANIPVNQKNIQTRLDYFVNITSDKGHIKQIFDNLSDIAKDTKIKLENIQSLNAFFQGIGSVANIDKKARKRIKSNLRYFSLYITKYIPDIYDELVKAGYDAKGKDKIQAMAYIGEFFEGIFKIAEFDSKKRKQLTRNLSDIKDIYLKYIFGKNGFIQQIIDSVKDVEDNSMRAIKSLKEIFDGFLSVGNISFIKLILLNVKLSLLNDIIKENLTDDGEDKSLISTISSINKRTIESAYDKIDLISELFENISKIHEALPSLKSILLASAKLGIINFVEFKLISLFFDTALNTENIDYKLISKEVVNIKKSFEKVKELNEFLADIPVKKALYNVTHLKKLFKSINKLSKLSITVKAKALDISIGGIKKAFGKIKGIIKSFEDIKPETIKNVQKIAKEFNKLLLISAGILIIGSLAMAKVNPLNIIAFTVSLSFFLWTTIAIFKKLSKIEKSVEIADSFMKLLAVSAAVLVFGSLAMKFIDVKNLFAFTITLGAFLFLMSIAFRIMAKSVEDNSETVEAFNSLLLSCAGVLTVGALFMKIVGPEPPILFGILLAGFVFIITTIFTIASKKIQRVAESVTAFSILVAVCAGVLMLGSLFMQNPKRIVGALAFAILLDVFVWSILKIFKNAGVLMTFALRSAKQMAILIAVSGIILMVGSLFMSDLRRAILTLAFALILDTFIFLVLKAFASTSEKIKKTLPIAISFAIVTAVSSFVLLLAGGLIAAFPDLLWAIPAFGLLLIVYTWAMMKVLNYVGNPEHQKRISKGIKTLFAIAGLTFVLSLAFRSIVKTAALITDWPNLLITIGVMALVILGLFVLAVAISAIGVEKMGLATVILAGLIGCIILIGIAMEKIADGLGAIAEVSKKKVNFGNLIGLMVGFALLVPVMAALAALIIPITLASISMVALKALLVNAAEAVEAYANLKIPIYKGAELVGYKIMDKKDFSNATSNIKTILTLLFDAISEVYHKNPTMFDFSLTSLLSGGGGTVFGKVAAAGKGLAIMLSLLSYAIRDWADLKIPIYEGEKIVGYKTIDNEAFAKAGKNIQAVITCLGQAILDIYKSAPKGMFDYEYGIFGGDNPFQKVSKSLSSMGRMLSEIANGITEWADLKIPIYKENSTEIQGYITLDNDAFVAAGENIKAVISCFANAILEIYDSRTELFEPQGFLGLGSSKFSIVSRALGNMGSALGNIAKGIKEWADLKIPIYKGKEIEKYISITNDDFLTASDNIKAVVSCLANAVLDIYNNDTNNLFDDGFLSTSPFNKVVKSIGKMGSALASIADGLKDWVELKIPVYKDGSTEIARYVTLTDDDFQKVGDNVSYVVTCLVSSIASLYTEHKDEGWFDEGFLGLSDSPISKVLNSIAPLGQALKDIADAVQAWADLKIPIYGQDKDGKAIITGYVSMSSDTFTKVNKHIEEVVTSLISAVAGLYFCEQAKKEEWFDGTGIFGLGDSPIGKVLGSIAPLGQTLKDIAQAVQAWADLKIPIYGQDKDGKAIITGYMTMDTGTFIKVSDNIGKVVTAIVSSIASVYNDPVAQREKWFEGGFFVGNSPIAKVLRSILPLGQALEGIANGVVAFADFKIPVYGVGKNGEAVVKDYITIDNNIMAQAGKNIGEIIKALALSIGKLYNDPEAKTQGWFDQDKWYTSTTPFGRVMSSLEPMANIVSGVAEGVKNFADFKIPIYGKNSKGELVIKDYKTLVDSDFEQATKNIGLVITTLGAAIATTVKEHGEILDTKSEQVVKVAEAIKTTADTLNSIASVIGYYSEGQFPILKYDSKGNLISGSMASLDDASIELMKKRVNAVIMALGGAIVDVYNAPENKEVWDQFEIGGIKKDSPMMIVAGAVNAIAESLNTTLDVIGKFTEMDFNSIAAQIGGEGGLRAGFQKVIETLVTLVHVVSEPVSIITYKRNNVLFTITLTKNIADWMNENAKYITSISSSVRTVVNGLKQIFEKVKELDTEYNKYKQVLNSSLFKVQENGSYILTETFSNLISFISSIYQLAENNSNNNDLNLDDYISCLRQLVVVIGNVDSDYDKKFNILEEGTLNLFAVIAGIKPNKNFSDHTKTLKSYVENTNKLSLPKIKSLTNLVNAINEFGDKFGNIDDFTNAIVDKLTESLDHLSGKLGEAKETIETTEKLHNKRKQLIEESVRNITELMDKELIVNIKEEQPGYTPVGGGTYDESDKEHGVSSQENTKPIGSGGSLGEGNNILTDESHEPDKNNSRTQDRSRQTNVTPQQQLYNPRPESSKFIQLDAGIIGQKIADAIREHLQQQ